MSVQAISAVLDHSLAKKGTRLTAISLANHADKYGLTWPSIRLAMEESLLERRTVQEAIDKLEAMGELLLLVEASGRDHRPPLYWLRLPGLSGEFAQEGGADRYFRIFGEELEGTALAAMEEEHLRLVHLGEEEAGKPGAKSAPGGGAESAPGTGAKSAPGGRRSRRGGARKTPAAPHRGTVTSKPSGENGDGTPSIPDAIRVPLQEAAQAKDAQLDLVAVERALKAYPDRDHAGEAEAFAGWHKPGGRGENAELRNVATAYRKWLKNSPAVAGKPDLTAIAGGGEGGDSPYGKKVIRSGDGN